MSLATYVIRPHVRGHVNDPRSRYRKRLRHPPQPKANAPETAEPATAETEAAPHAQAAAARWQRITELNARLNERLASAMDDEAQALWLALEEALHVHWLDVAVDHYNRGYEAGRAQAFVDRELAQRAAPRDKLRALAAALQDLADHLDGAAPPRSSH